MTFFGTRIGIKLNIPQCGSYHCCETNQSASCVAAHHRDIASTPIFFPSSYFSSMLCFNSSWKNYLCNESSLARPNFRLWLHITFFACILRRWQAFLIKFQIRQVRWNVKSNHHRDVDKVKIKFMNYHLLQ